MLRMRLTFSREIFCISLVVELDLKVPFSNTATGDQMTVAL
jgi:hypothetical protein